MHYQIWNFFYSDDEVYQSWKAKVNQENIKFNQFTWEKISHFLWAIDQNSPLKTELIYTHSLGDFIEKARDNGYSFTEDELASVVITGQEIWNLFAIAQKTPPLEAELRSAKNPQEFIKIAAENGYHFSIEALGWLLTNIKSYSQVSITSCSGDSYCAPAIGRIHTLQWICLAEEWGLVAPFCHRDKPNLGILSGWDRDIDDDKSFWSQCWLPRGYFNQRLMSQS